MRYPEDLFKVQRDMLGAYHVLDPKTFYEGNDKWDVPEDPATSTRKQPPYRLSVATKSGEEPVFSLTSVYVPQKKQNLAAFMSVGADAAEAGDLREVPDPAAARQHPGGRARPDRQPVQRDAKVATQLLAFKQADVKCAVRQPADPAGGRRAALRAAAVHDP